MTAPDPAGGYTGGLPNPLNPDQVGGAVRRVVGVLPGATEAAGFLDAIVATRRWVSDRHNWVRIGWFVGGSALMYGGLIILARKQISAGVEAVGKVKGDVAGLATAAVTKGAVK